MPPIIKLTISTPAKALNKAYLRQSLKREQIELFKANLARLFDRIRVEEQDTFPQIMINDILQFPMPEVFKELQALIIERVQQILAAPDSPDVLQLEAEIDRLVYDLYGLTDEEIALVEGKA